ncbi:uncharacterized protein LOC135581845 isoform X1 [Musa acuminata AAA Group]|uniref:uncharacterized protein LOC135581845 isoform X1 n=1 Tax=Musa acuminata AAA Group TaxID=214697 RepID=UPI0031D22AA4
MIVSGKSFAPRFRWFPHLLPCSSNRRLLKPARAKKENIGGDSQAGETTFSLRASKAVLARSAVVLFGLGFLDAGYSGDWSRIGVISKETEDLLKIAAYLRNFPHKMEAQKPQSEKLRSVDQAMASCRKKKSEEASFLEDLRDHMDEFINASMDEHKSCFKKTIQKMFGMSKSVAQRTSETKEVESSVPLETTVVQ